MSDVDFIRMTAMLVLPKLIGVSADPINDAIYFAERLLSECQKRENV